MFYYPVLTTKKLPIIFYYSSKTLLSIGQIVIVPLQSQLIEGIIFQNPKTESEIIAVSIELDKIKEIQEIKPFILHINQIQFIKFLINNTFGNPGIILTTFLQSFKLLSATSWKILQINYEKNNLENQNKIQNIDRKDPTKKLIPISNVKSEKLVDYLKIRQENYLQKTKPEFNFWLEQNYTQRIIYIIRNWKQKTQKNLETKISLENQIKNENIKENLILKNSLEEAEKIGFQKLLQSDKKNIFDIVIIFPEKKLMDKVYNNLKDLPIWNNFLYKLESKNWILENYFFSSQNNKESRQTILALLGIESNKKIDPKTKKKIKKNLESLLIENSQNLEKYLQDLQMKIEANFKEIINENIAQNPIQNLNYKIRLIWGTRSSLFLPFANLSSIILIDEANSFHIQEQNGLYFDTREAVFLLHRACEIDLDFVSILPSVRFQDFYKSNNLTTDNSNSTSDDILQKNNKLNNSNFDNDNQKKSQIKITKFNKKYDNYQLFSHQIEQILQTDQDFEYFGED